MFSASIIAEAQMCGMAAYPKEAVGIVVRNSYIGLANVSQRPEATFEVDPVEFLKKGGNDAEALIHSHPDYWPVPSERDMRQQAAMDIPWGIYNVRPDKSPTAAHRLVASKVAWFGRQVPKGPLYSKNGGPVRWFMHGFTDCLSEIEDWHEIQGVKLPPSPRSWEWWLDSVDEDGKPQPAKDFYRDLYQPYGFERIDGPVPGAVGMCCLGETPEGKPILTPNHAGIYLGNGQFLHHLARRSPIDQTRPAHRDPYAHWARHFNAPPIWVRHKDLPLKGLRDI